MELLLYILIRIAEGFVCKILHHSTVVFLELLRYIMYRMPNYVQDAI